VYLRIGSYIAGLLMTAYEYLRDWRSRGEHVVLTVGTWDLSHPGHVNIVNQCRQLAGPRGKVVVGVNEDEFVLRFKGRLPVMSLEERMKVMGSLKGVDEVLPNTPGDTLKPLIEQTEATLLVVGSDWADKDYHSQIGCTPEWLAEHNCAIVYVPRTPDISTTEIRERIFGGTE
jgi:glycerol-3-phosphate cytidylyltransferase